MPVFEIIYGLEDLRAPCHGNGYRQCRRRVVIRAGTVLTFLLRAISSRVTEAHVDLFSDRPWPDDLSDVLRRLRARAEESLGPRRRRPTYMGVDVVLADTEDLQALALLAPHVIHAEAWSRSIVVFSAHDSGDSILFDLTETELAKLNELLAELPHLRPLVSVGELPDQDT
jgi:hypothetical protein